MSDPTAPQYGRRVPFDDPIFERFPESRRLSVRPLGRGRLLEWPRLETSPDEWTYYTARRERYDERLLRLREVALELVSAGYQLATTFLCHKDGRTPTRKAWHVDAIKTPDDLLVDLSEHAPKPGPRNLQIVTGPGMAPGGGWLIHLEADADKADPWGPTRAAVMDSLERLTAGMAPTPTWESRRGMHLLATVPDEFGQAFYAHLSKHELEGYHGVELIFGGYLHGRRKASSAMIPPSETDGVERVWVDRTLTPAPLPDAALAILAKVGRASAEEAAERAEEAWARRGAVIADFHDLDDEEAEAWEAYRRERLLADLSEVGPAISGHGRHNTTLRAALMVASAGYDGDQAEALLADYSSAYCDPEWSEQEIKHKVEDAIKYVGEDKRKEARLWSAWTKARDRAARFGPPAETWVPSGPPGGGR